MRKIYPVISALLATILLSGLSAWSQVVDLSDLAKEKGLEEGKKQAFGLTSGLGFTTIDGVLHYRVRAVPELRFAKFSAGLNVDLLWNSKTGAIRPADKYDGKRFSRIIDHIGYGGPRTWSRPRSGPSRTTPWATDS